MYTSMNHIVTQLCYVFFLLKDLKSEIPNEKFSLSTSRFKFTTLKPLQVVSISSKFKLTEMLSVSREMMIHKHNVNTHRMMLRRKLIVLTRREE
jgi:hypothetical protein